MVWDKLKIGDIVKFNRLGDNGPELSYYVFMGTSNYDKHGNNWYNFDSLDGKDGCALGYGLANKVTIIDPDSEEYKSVMVLYGRRTLPKP